MREMRRKDRQVTDPNRIANILDTAKVLHLGLAVDNMPYVVPMNYGYTMDDGKLTLYLHSALQGKKLDMLRANPNVFFEMECDLEPITSDEACRHSISYSSLMGCGLARIIEDAQEKQKAMSILMKAQTGKGYFFDENQVSTVAVIRIDASEYTAKHRPLPEK